MKVGILTLIPYDNYGGILQGYALQTVLERMGHEVYILQTKRYDYLPLKLRLLYGVNWFFNRLIGASTVYIYPYLLRDFRVKNLKPFISQYIHFTRRFKGKEDLVRFVKKENFEGFVVGSDQVWRPNLSPDLDYMFLNFLPRSSTVCKVAYAASFGYEKVELGLNVLEKYKDNLKRFDAVSVREASGIELCKTLFGIEAQLVVDPTLLLEREDYEFLVQNYRPINSKVQLLSYVLFASEKRKEIIQRIANMLHLEETVEMMPKYFLHQVKTHVQLKDTVFAPLEEWLSAYSVSSFVVTDSFHGTVFCLIFHVPFLVLAPAAVDRIKTLLNMVNLSDRILYPEEELDDTIIKKTIDWELVDERINQSRVFSMEFIAEALKKNRT